MIQTRDCEGEILIAGQACRLPGAPSIAAFWEVLREGLCTIGEVGDGRWPRGRYLHPRPGEPGKTYTFRAGTIEAPWSFDPAPFGMSPREAAQVDPQQRLALELVWEALEDAGVPTSQLAGTRVGVYVGASSVDHGSRRVFDAAGGDGYHMTGSALSLIANRISYCFDFTGPSLVVDTACSSSLVALNEAVTALRAGAIDTAIVAGVNILLSPFPFVGFAQARMLSPDGLCRAFASGADGYVRSEGGVALVLVRAGAVGLDHVRAHARIIASGVNSDGRTIGVSLPSAAAQGRLLRGIYDEAGIDPNHLAFVEAHGTGTRVGDPIEAHALGEALGRRRRTPLPIGSVKSNVGHLEPASGLVGLLKAILALQHDLLPPTLHADALNPDIPFAELNLQVARTPVAFAPARRPRLAGISTFGFGGTNAHVVIAQAPAPRAIRRRPVVASRRRQNCQRYGDATQARLGTLISAETGPALTAFAGRLAGVAIDSAEAEAFAAALVHHRELMPERAIVIGDPATGLGALSRGVAAPNVVRGRAVVRSAPVAFVFCGNGAQWAGMGRAALANDPIFRRHIAAIDALIQREAKWSVLDMLAADDLDEPLKFTSIAQPLLFALQAAATDTLRARGLEPTIVIGHSVGEVAAAYAAGCYDLRQAVRLVLARSAAQEFARGRGRMAVLHAGASEARKLIAESCADSIEIAALNSPMSVTLVGAVEALDAVLKEAATAGLAGRLIDLDYPFHSRVMDGARRQLATDLRDLAGSAGRATFISTVEGRPLQASELDADYWWRNVRQPVQFADAVAQAAALGAGVFVEIGPRSVLKPYLDQCLRGADVPYAVVPTFSREDSPAVDALAVAAANAIVNGAHFDIERAFGPPPAAGWRHLPHYAWQRVPLMSPQTTEALGGIETGLAGAASDGLIGYRASGDAMVWHAHLDTTACSELGEHRVAGKPWLPAAAFVDMALTAAQIWLGQERVELRDLDIVRPLVLSDQTMDVRTRLDPETATCEIASRRRLSDDAWQVHVRCRVAVIASGEPSGCAVSPRAADTAATAADVYARAERVGLDYGPAFRRVGEVRHDGNGAMHVHFDPASGAWSRGFVIAPIDLDGAFHGLLALSEQHQSDGPAYLPVRLRRVRVFRPSVRAARAVITDLEAGARSLSCNLMLLDRQGALIARVEGAQLTATTIRSDRDTENIAYHFAGRRHLDAKRSTSAPPDLAALRGALADLLVRIHGPSEEAVLLLDAAAQRAAYDALSAIECGSGRDLAAGLDAGRAIALGIARHGALVVESDGGERLVEDCPIPPLDRIVSTLLAEHPGLGAECALLADVAASFAEESAWPPSTATWQHARLSSPRARAAHEHVLDAVGLMLAHWPADRPLRTLQLGADLLQMAPGRIDKFAAEGSLRLVVADTDETALETLRGALKDPVGTTLAVLNDEGLAEIARFGPFDAVIASHALHRLDASRLSAVRSLLTEGGVLFAVEADAGPFNELVRGLASAREGWTKPIHDVASWREVLSHAGYIDVDVRRRTELGGAIVLTALAAKEEGVVASATADFRSDGALPARTARILAVDRRLAAPFAARLKTALGARSPIAASGGEAAARCAADVVVLADAGRDSSPQRAIADTIALMKSVLANADTAPGRLWVVASGGARHIVGEGAADPVAAAIWALMRTIANEHPGIDVRLVDFAEGLDVAAGAARLAELIAAPGSESEMVLTAGGHVALRAVPGAPPVSSRARSADAVRLELARPGAPQTLRWSVADRRAPGDDEVEIAVAATGLNFRDVMWVMGMLPAEALEGGFAGATIGFECAGLVVRKGGSVGHLEVGDRVFAVAPAALASHVTVSAAAVGRLAGDVDLAAAATVPVAFLTAHYALIRVAQLRVGEWVLIHGGAGGVGLAALQIARAAGARTIMTAGTREKRALLRLLGADHVLSSRSLAFEEDVRAIVPDGVHVVLNSLAGAAMERSLELVRPFGRFLELGKRDYFENTKIALRPFRRNVAYFGIDVDQLMQHDPGTAREMMQELSRRLARGELRPLPYRRFEADQVLAAFRLMQQSGHIGKIVITPPVPEQTDVLRPADPFTVARDGAHLVIGGLGGFGSATAVWLAERGARTLVLASRSGIPGADATAAIAALRAKDVEVLVEACDVADADEVARLLQRIRDAGHRLRSVFHCAMVIEDATLANVSPEGVARVLAPKVDGARHLDRLTRGESLDHFVLYSSVTTLFGNPGQAAYVAANGYLEGLARARSAEGLPALAVAWGAIGDTGYLARGTRAGASLDPRALATSMTAAEALRHLEAVLARADQVPPVVTIARLDWSAMSRVLPVLRRPAFAALAAPRDRVDTSDGASDPGAEIEGLDIQAATAVLVRHLTHMVGIVMRAPPSSVDARRPFVDMGIDSLMTIELQYAAKDRFGVELPLGALAGGATIEELAARLLQRLRGGPVSTTEANHTLLGKHLDRHAAMPRAVAAQ